MVGIEWGIVVMVLKSKMSLSSALYAFALSLLIANPALATDNRGFGEKNRETKAIERLVAKNIIQSKSKSAKLQKEEKQKFANAFGAWVAYLHASDHAKLHANITKSSFARARSNLIILNSGTKKAELLYVAVKKIEQHPLKSEQRTILNSRISVSGFAVYVVPFQFSLGNTRSELKSATVFSKSENRRMIARVQDKSDSASKIERPIAEPECNDVAPMPGGTFVKQPVSDIRTACFSNTQSDKLALN